MKRIFYFIFAAALTFFVASCGCSNKSEAVDTTAVEVDTTFTILTDSVSAEELLYPTFVEQSIVLDKEYMYLQVDKKFRWYETCVLLAGKLDELNDYQILGVSNIMQGADNKTISVYCFAHNVNGKDSVAIAKNNFWVEDFDLNKFNEPMITAEEAFYRVREANFKLPHSAYITLRRQVGPVPNVNPQYIFGNNFSGTLFVDAVTGDVTDKNPTGV